LRKERLHLTTHYCYVEKIHSTYSSSRRNKIERNYERNIKREEKVLKTGDRIASAGPDETGIIC
jgi:G:T-mismatch repair DNA endonuclease (very short patch repair protein)